MVLQVHRADGAVLLVALWVLMAASGCAPAPTAGPAPEAARVKADKVDFIDASLYCETSVDMFCSYYVRCGRMAVADLAELKLDVGVRFNECVGVGGVVDPSDIESGHRSFLFLRCCPPGEVPGGGRIKRWQQRRLHRRHGRPR